MEVCSYPPVQVMILTNIKFFYGFNVKFALNRPVGREEVRLVGADRNQPVKIYQMLTT